MFHLFEDSAHIQADDPEADQDETAQKQVADHQARPTERQLSHIAVEVADDEPSAEHKREQRKNAADVDRQVQRLLGVGQGERQRVHHQLPRRVRARSIGAFAMLDVHVTS